MATCQRVERHASGRTTNPVARQVIPLRCLQHRGWYLTGPVIRRMHSVFEGTEHISHSSRVAARAVTEGGPSH